MDIATLLTKLPASSRRGIAALNITKLEEFTNFSESEIQRLQGVGPKAVSLISDALAEQGLAFQSWTEGKTVLVDPKSYPDDAELSHHLGPVKELYDQMVDELGQCTPPISLEWRYYTDGNSWLGKTTAKKQTIIWVTVCHHLFKASFYFKPKALPLLKQSGLDEHYEQQWNEIEATGKTKAVTVDIDGPEKLDHVRQLVQIKLEQI